MDKKTELPVNEIRITCRTTAPEDVIQELGQSKDIQAFKRFTYSGFEFRIVDVRSISIKELSAKAISKEEQIAIDKKKILLEYEHSQGTIKYRIDNNCQDED